VDPALRETHSAVVAMVGDCVYKVKKPVRLAFLDFSTVEARRAVCAREVALNRRLAPDVYLGVGEWRSPGAAPDAPPEPVVVMRRMPDDRRLASLATAPDGPAEFVYGAVRAIARIMATFHARADRSPEIDQSGTPEFVATKFATDVAEARAVASGVLDPGVIDAVDRRGTAYLAGRLALLEQRVRAGMIVDGHGDLLADDIFCLPDGPRILDCIEFDDRLRWGDVLADIAFLVMDLERLGAHDLATQLLAAYVEFSNEHHPSSLAHYYIASRALIRAKVTAVRAHQGDRSVAPLAQALLLRAADHLQQGRVTCTLVGGGPGTGKSSIAEAIAAPLDAVVLSSDEIRKELAGLPHTTPAGAAFERGIYDPAHTDRTYAELTARARQLLEHGVSVVLDASWSREAHRDAARAVAAATASELHELRCTAPAPVTHERIAVRRSAGPQVSDATVEIADALVATADPWPCAVTLDTDAPLYVVEAAARRAIG